MKKPGLAVVISSPSGTGKTTVCRRLVKKHADFQFSISATTRAPRGSETNGMDYFFLSEAKFLAEKKAGRFIESARYLDNWYGTPAEPLRKSLGKGQVVLLDIDVQGAKAVKNSLPEAVSIFLVPPGQKELRRRLANRRTESAAEIRKRLQTARDELRNWQAYDYVVVNDKLAVTVKQVETIIEAERLKSKRLNDKRYWEKTLANLLGLTETSR